MRVVLKQKVKKEVIEHKEMDLIEKWVLRVWQGSTKLEERTYRSEPSSQEIAEVLYKYRDKKGCEATLNKKFKLLDAIYWDEL